MEQNSDIINESKRDTLMTDKQKKPFISFAKINKYFLIPFITPVFCMFANYFLYKIKATKVVKNEEFIFTCYVLLSYIGVGCFYFISKFRQKVEGAKENFLYRESTISSIKYIYNEGIKKNILKGSILIIFLAFLLSLAELFSIYINKNKVHLLQERLYYLLFIPLFCKFILKDNIFKHHYFSLLIAMVGFSLLFIPICLKIDVDDIVPNVLNFVGSVGYSLFLVIIKYLTHVYYMSPFKLSLIFGTIAFFFIFFGFLIYSLIKYHDLTYFKESLDFSYADNKFVLSLYFIACFIFAVLLHFCTLLVIFYFSPILLMVTDIISPFLLWIALTIENKSSTEILELILNPIGYVIVLFASLIYNEIIIFNFCGLNKNTKKFIEERLYKESKDIRKTENDLKLGNLDRSDEDLGTSEDDRNSHSS